MTVPAGHGLNVNTANAQTLPAILSAPNGRADEATYRTDPTQMEGFIMGGVTLAKSFLAGAPLFRCRRPTS